MADDQPTKRTHNFKDLTGEKFGRLSVKSMSNETRGRARLWNCECACGKAKVVRGDCLRGGITQSCGCLQKERASQATSTHRLSKRPEYGVWKTAKNRCFSPAVPAYSHYGARGITMCREWASSFKAFFESMGPCPPGLTLERINNDGNYEPGNCKWATRTEQARNTRDATFVMYEGERMHLKDLAERIGISYKTLHARHRRGIPLLVPLNTKPRRTR